MARGHPDWGQYPSFSSLAVYDLSGEQSARLGSPVTMFRDGLICFMDDFRHGLGSWTDASTLGGSLILVSSPTPPHSPYSAQLDAPATDGAIAKATAIVPFPATPTIGVYVIARVDGTPVVMFVEADIYTGAFKIYTGFRLIASGVWLLHEGGGYTAISPALADPLAVAGRWGAFQLVTNLSAASYARARSNTGSVVPDVGALDADVDASAPRVEIRLQCNAGDPPSANQVTVGAVIVTYDEPE